MLQKIHRVNIKHCLTITHTKENSQLYSIQYRELECWQPVIGIFVKFFGRKS